MQYYRMESVSRLASLLICCQFIRGQEGLPGEQKFSTMDEPQFTAQIKNMSVPAGRDASLECHVTHSKGYKVAWVRVDTQTILTMNQHVITRNHRIQVVNPERNIWRLDISQVKKTDAGFYMCQVNTDPMKSQEGYLEVVEPPSIVDSGTSIDQSVEEGEKVVLSCRADGYPPPEIGWKREDGKPILDKNPKDKVTGPIINIEKVSRRDMGAYFCMAHNGVPPIVSRRIVLNVYYPPNITVNQQVVGRVGESVEITCDVEGFPSPITSWTRLNNKVIKQGGRYNVTQRLEYRRSSTTLTIKRLNKKDNFSKYKCSGRNNKGSADEYVTVRVIEPDHNNEVAPEYKKTSVDRSPTVQIYELPEKQPEDYQPPIDYGDYKTRENERLKNHVYQTKITNAMNSTGRILMNVWSLVLAVGYSWIYWKNYQHL